LAVSTPEAMVAGIEGAIDVGHLVRLMAFHEGRAALTKLTLPEGNPLVGQQVGQLDLPGNAVLVTVLRGDKVTVPQPGDVLDAGDELVFVSNDSFDLSNKSGKGPPLWGAIQKAWRHDT
jgi:trk/ktr system potassium uptake protein